ncbi:MAG: hypothetical protein FWE94_07360, partial [Coriobacteriia bacterium]|nr:hypothetical protein [Coriobacteriia bacterium]
HAHEPAEPNLLLVTAAITVALLGIGIAYASYIRRLIEPDGYLRNALVKNVFAKKFFVDEAYNMVVISPIMRIAELLGQADGALVDGAVRGFGWLGLKISALLAVFDREGVDAGAVDGLGNRIVDAGEVRRVHTGNVQTYLLLFSAAVVVIVLVVVLL